MFGDVCGKIGRKAVAKILPELKKKYGPDLVIANVENLAHGKGTTVKTLEEMTTAGVDFFTSGDHAFDKNEVNVILEEKDSLLIRPANFPDGVPGKGEKVFEIGTKKVLVVNLLGRVFMKSQYDCPFKKADEILEKYKDENLSAIIVDFHAEATSEKIAMGRYLDGRVSAVLGTHTHVQTADERILEKGTGYVTDVGMNGPFDSIIGMNPELALTRFLTQIPQRYQQAKGVSQYNAACLEFHPVSGRCLAISMINKIF